MLVVRNGCGKRSARRRRSKSVRDPRTVPARRRETRLRSACATGIRRCSRLSRTTVWSVHTSTGTGSSASSVQAGDGDDRVRIEEVNGAFTDTEETTLAGGFGDDDLRRGSSRETFSAVGRAPTRSTETRAVTSRPSVRATTASRGTPATGVTSSKDGRVSTRSSSTARRRTTLRRVRQRRAPALLSERGQHRDGCRRHRAIDLRTLGGADTVVMNDLSVQPMSSTSTSI